MPSESSRAQLDNMDKAEFIELLRFCLPASKSSKSRFTNKAHSPGGLMTNWQSIARRAVSCPQVMVCENPSPEVYDENRDESGVDKREIPGTRIFMSGLADSSTSTGNRGHSPASALLAGPEVNEGGQTA